MATNNNNRTPEGRPGTGGTDRQTVMFTCSQNFLDALDKFTGEKNESRSAIVREAVAALIGYDLKNEPKADRQRKYANVEERKAAMLARAKERRQLTAKLLKAHEDEETAEVIAALVASLRNA